MDSCTEEEEKTKRKKITGQHNRSKTLLTQEISSKRNTTSIISHTLAMKVITTQSSLYRVQAYQQLAKQLQLRPFQKKKKNLEKKKKNRTRHTSCLEARKIATVSRQVFQLLTRVQHLVKWNFHQPEHKRLRELLEELLDLAFDEHLMSFHTYSLQLLYLVLTQRPSYNF